jgi:hypothetical protein
MKRTQIVDSAYQVHTSMQAPHSAGQIASAPGKASQPAPKGSVEPLNKGSVEHSPTLALLYQSFQLLLGALCQSPGHIKYSVPTLFPFLLHPHILFDHLSDDHSFPGHQPGSASLEWWTVTFRLWCSESSLHRPHIGGQPVHSYQQRKQWRRPSTPVYEVNYLLNQGSITGSAAHSSQPQPG